MTVFERAERSGGAFRYAGKAPLFQDVVANQNSFDLYIEALTLACAAKGVTIRYHVDVTRWPELLRPFDRIVIATGAAYRFGLGPVATAMLDWGVARWPLIRQVLSMPSLRDWFYHRARQAHGCGLPGLGAAGPAGGRDRRRAGGRQKPAGHFERLRGRVKKLILVKDLETFSRIISHNLDAEKLMLTRTTST